MIELGRLIRDLIIRFLDWLYIPFAGWIPRETFRYGATGGANTVLDIFLYFLFYNFVLGKNIVHFGRIAISPHIAAFLIVFPITFTTGFILAKYVTFTNSAFRGRKQLIRYGFVVAGAILINYLLLKLFVDIWGLYPTPSKLIITLFVVVYSYLMQRYYSFQTAAISIIRKRGSVKS